MAQSELIAPISTDLRQGDNRMDITKGIERINVKDEKMSTALAAAGCVAGDWVIKTSTGVDLPTGTPAAGTYPVWVGNDQYDSQATGNATIIVSGGFLYRTTKFVAASYTVGQNLTVDNTGLRGAVSTEPVLARVYNAPDAAGIMEVEVLNR